jgi:MFS family permease
MGLGMGLMFLPALTMTSHYFRKKRSLAMGIVVSGTRRVPARRTTPDLTITGSSIGACLYPVLLNNLFGSNLGFGWGVRFDSHLSPFSLHSDFRRSVAFLDLGLLAVANAIMKPKLKPRKHQHDAPPPATFKEVMRDVPFLVYGAGTFLVRLIVIRLRLQFSSRLSIGVLGCIRPM